LKQPFSEAFQKDLNKHLGKKCYNVVVVSQETKMLVVLCLWEVQSSQGTWKSCFLFIYSF